MATEEVEAEVTTNEHRVKYDPGRWVLSQTPRRENKGLVSWLLIPKAIKKNKKAASST